MKIPDLVREAFESVLDVIAPLRARSARTKGRTSAHIPLLPTEHALLGERITTLMDYREPEVQDLIRALKYDRSAHAARLAAELLAEYLREEIASLKLFSARPVFLAPIPLHKSRERERGFNQIEIVLERVPQAFKDGTAATFAPRMLARTRATPTQTKLARKARIQNVEGAFEVRDKRLVAGAHIFLIDDITTTGATLVSAGRALAKLGAEVSLIALARA